MLARILLLMMLLPVAEIAVLIWLADLTNWWVVLGMLIGAGVLGAALARQQGLRSLGRLSRQFGAERAPGDAVFDAVLISLASVLLILPGLLSDVVAILILLPATRRVIKAALRQRFQVRFGGSPAGGSGFGTSGFGSTSGFGGSPFGGDPFDGNSPYGRSARGEQDRIIDVKVLDPPQE